MFSYVGITVDNVSFYRQSFYFPEVVSEDGEAVTGVPGLCPGSDLLRGT